MNTNWKIQPGAILHSSPIIPVIVVNNTSDAINITQALLDGGINVIEITLRTPQALSIIAELSQRFPDAKIGAGTVTTQEQHNQAEDAGAIFCISPGSSKELLEAATASSIPLIPGVSTVSEAMIARNIGYRSLKFFPAEAAGGPKVLKAIAGPFPDLLFCPTGGISPDNAASYLALKNVACVGGSWLVPAEAVEQSQWHTITDLAKSALHKFQV